MEIKKITSKKKQFLDLLLLADEQESMIDKYLERGDLYALYDDDLKSICVVTEESREVCELKSLATYEKYQKQGYARKLIKHIFEVYRDKYKTMLVGTGDVDEILSFYQKSGFVISHRKKDFFVDNYDHPIFENGKQLRDMVYLRKDF